MTRIDWPWVLPCAVVALAGCQCGVPPQVVLPSDGGTACDNTLLATGCTFGRCMLSTASRPLPDGGIAEVFEDPIPAPLEGDVISPVLCRVVLPAGVTTQLTLAIRLDTAAPANATLFSYDAVALASRAEPSHPLDDTVTGLIAGAGSFGVTLSPGDWAVSSWFGVPPRGSKNVPELLRNLTSASFTAAFYDGRRLFVANGPRLLIYDGLPQTAATWPSVVLGQVDLDSDVSSTTASLFGPVGVTSVWSDGSRLVVGAGNRVLVWRTMPVRNLTPADLVLGQPDFNSNAPNAGGVGAGSLGSVSALDSDGTQLVVADPLNHRVLAWRTFPTAVSQPAEVVVGQPDFVSNGPYGGAFPLYLPRGVALEPNGLYVSGLGGPALAHTPALVGPNPASDFAVFGWQFNGGDPGSQVARPAGVVVGPGGGVAVRDISLRRILLTRGPKSAPSAADFVLGQPDESRVVGLNWLGGTSSANPSRISGSTISDAFALGRGDGTLLVPDDRRLLIYDTFPTYNFEPATRVLGQAGTAVNETVDYRTISASTLASPADVAVQGTTLAVADRGNNRVLLYDAASLGALAPAAFAVVGQPDGTSYLANVDLRATSATRLSGPGGVALDGTRLVVADTENHRVLIWNAVPRSSGVAADLVLGQADFSGRRPNRGRGDVAPVDGYSDVGPDGFFYPTGVATDGVRLFVADRLNSRVLIWDTFPTQSGQPASRVLGQPDMKSSRPHGGAGPFAVSASGFNLPTGIALSGSSLWVADTENNRVVRYDDVFTAPTPAAFIGQSSGTAVSNPNYRFGTSVFAGNPESPATTSASVLRPRGLAVAGGRLFVSEVDSNRVHVFDTASLAPVAVLGQRTTTGAAPNLDGVGPTSMAEPSGLATDGQHLWVADSRNHRVLGFRRTAIATGAAPDLLVGQPSFFAVGFNGTSTAADGATAAPRGLSIDGDSLYVADTNNHRVIVFRTAGSVSPTRIIGQPNDTLALPNAGGAASARTLSGPRGVEAVGERVAVADTGNHRVLLFERSWTSPDAVAVLGQGSMTATAPNRAAPPSLASLNAPGGLCSDGAALFVADTGNHRLLGWRALPTASGQPADVVLGQADGASVLGNRGAEPTGRSMSLPTACLVRGGKLFVADTGNNRVLRFDAPFAESGAGANGVLGQPGFTARIPAARADELSALAGPAGLAGDGTNLYVVDRDLARVVVYGPGFLGTDAGATSVLSEIGGAAVQQVLGGIAARREGLFTTRLFVSDTNANRIANVRSVTRLQP